MAWYKLDECMGSTVHSTNETYNSGLNGTITIGASGTQTSAGTCGSSTSTEAWSNGTTGKVNGSLNFDGTDDYIQGTDPSSGALDFGTSDFTLSAWTYRTGTGTSIVIGKRAYPPGYVMYYNNATNAITVQVNDSSPHAYNVGTPSCQNAWCLLTAVIRRSTNQLLFYVNGNLFSTTDISATAGSVDNAGWFGIGADSSDTSSVFQGKIDDVRVYNYGLTPQQVKDVYNGGAVKFGE